MQKYFNQMTISALLAQNAWLYPDNAAYIFNGKTYTWAEVDRVTDVIAYKMIHMGLSAGMHVGFWSMNTIDLVLYMLSAMKIGVIPAAINYSYKSFELKNILQSADITCLFIGESKKNVDFEGIVGEIRDELPKLKSVYMIDGKVDRYIQMENCIICEQSLKELYECEITVTAQDIAAITFTSGTTKIPKAVQVSFESVISDAAMIADRLLMRQEDVIMAPVPIFHSSGLSATIIQPMTKGAASVIERMFEAQTVLQDISQHHTTVLLVIPSMMELLCRQPDFDQYDLSSLRVALTSGARIAPARLKKVVEKLGLKHFLMAYGQTECSPIVTTTLYDDPLETAMSSDGIPLPFVEVRIWDNERNALQRNGLIGEIQVRGINVMRGYYHNSEENAKKFTDDEWLRTTDAGYMDSEGSLHFVSRMDDMIIWHGENISPCEIEAVIEDYSEKISNVKVVGVCAQLVQEEIAAVIKADAPIDQDDLRDFIKSKLANFKVPKYIFQIDDYPLTNTGKSDAGRIRKIATQLVYT